MRQTKDATAKKNVEEIKQLAIPHKRWPQVLLKFTLRPVWCISCIPHGRNTYHIGFCAATNVAYHKAGGKGTQVQLHMLRPLKCLYVWYGSLVILRNGVRNALLYSFVFSFAYRFIVCLALYGPLNAFTHFRVGVYAIYVGYT